MHGAVSTMERVQFAQADPSIQFSLLMVMTFQVCIELCKSLSERRVPGRVKSALGVPGKVQSAQDVPG